MQLDFLILLTLETVKIKFQQFLRSESKDMAIAKVIEVIAEGDTVEDAIKNAAKEASKTLKNIRSIYAEGIQGMVDDGKVKSFRVNCKVTFVID